MIQYTNHSSVNLLKIQPQNPIITSSSIIIIIISFSKNCSQSEIKYRIAVSYIGDPRRVEQINNQMD